MTGYKGKLKTNEGKFDGELTISFEDPNWVADFENDSELGGFLLRLVMISDNITEREKVITLAGERGFTRN